MNKNNIVKARTCVYNVNYHIVWCTKYRKKILTPEITNELKQLLNEIAEEKGFIIQECEVGNDDHVHLFVSAHPKIAPSYIIKMLKGISGRKLFLNHPEISKNLWKGELWNNSYYIETIGSISEEVIKKYIERQ